MPRSLPDPFNPYSHPGRGPQLFLRADEEAEAQSEGLVQGFTARGELGPGCPLPLATMDKCDSLPPWADQEL